MVRVSGSACHELEFNATEDPPSRGTDARLTCRGSNVFLLACCGNSEREVPTQVWSSSLDDGSKLRGPSPIALVFLYRAMLISIHLLKFSLRTIEMFRTPIKTFNKEKIFADDFIEGTGVEKDRRV
ncbi:hypothetical protein TNCV_1218731 [Trichonephila clavipes]|nr:hypothetical protein TNCV_1218731 [Trichonephila clavipes]